ncbi:flagellar hook-length control protein FliK [Variovorax sp. J31P207]|uniref:flagellar hook-length control protein FliK n=1 Tax=Variovorax sp. J31P207 TaxID=3053510 RepID=UPI0025787909|nr:flagellar hook-length control protein FliK [Variovorax sp. J31P207]MDM0070958.1 flagellar hook-length control protein FliK [Variovorax sp. J31P207]
MSGLTGLIDALLAVKASPRLDVLAIKAETRIGAPGAVAEVLKVENDVRLPSKAALDRVLPGGPSSLPPAASARPAPEAELSVAARVISAVLADLESDAGPVRGAAPAWPSRQAPSAPALAGALAQTVAQSGLFYESHLLEFAAGARPLVQLMQEPQARWATPLAAQRAAESAPAAAATASGEGAPTAEEVVRAVAEPTLDEAGALPRNAQPAVAAAAGNGAAPAAGPAPLGAAAAVDNTAPDAGPAPTPDAARLQAAYGRGEATVSVPAADAPAAERVEEAGASHHAAAFAPKAAVPLAEVIHPQAVNLVHQQLDLLATAVFRWSGEAWPGVAMNWTVEKEAADPSDEESGDDPPQRWSTTVAMSLPRLGQVDLRLSLAGPGVQARLAASEAGTVATLRADGGTLVQRMEAAGLRLQDLQVAPMAPAGGAS